MAELIALNDLGEAVFASGVSEMTADGRDLLLTLSPGAHGRLAAFCAEVGEAPVLVEAVGHVAARSSGCEGLAPDAYRLQAAARHGSQLPDRLQRFIALQPQDSAQPVLAVYRMDTSFTLSRDAISSAEWRAEGVELTPSYRLGEALQTLDTAQNRWMITYDGVVLGGWDRVEVSPERISLRTANAPAMQAWRASLEG
ncbi:MAG: hypothetical protein ACFE0P_00245 [Oceanicaulis sp.]